MLGLTAVVGLAPRIPARAAAASPAPVSPTASFQLHPEARAVARRPGSV
ncbi:MAG: hypothetical protein ABUL65_03375 [Opitutus sp.]